MEKSFRDYENIEDWNEDSVYTEKDKQSQHAPGLFSLSPAWFRHNKYEMVSYGLNIYIKPAEGSFIEWYKPFEIFDQLLGDFMQLVLDIKDLDLKVEAEVETEVVDGVEIEAEDDTAGINSDIRKAELIYSFISKYGPLGLFWDGVQHAYFTGEETIQLIVVPKWPPPSFIDEINEQPADYFGGSPPMDYDQYASTFFPGENAPYPCLEKTNADIENFFQHYSEPVEHILRNKTFQHMSRHIATYRDYIEGEHKPEDIHPQNSKLPWADALNLSLEVPKLGFSFEGRDWQLSWRFNSMLQAISIMHLMNLTGQMGGGVKVCALNGCNKTVIGKNRKYCGDDHGNLFRVRKSLAKKNNTNA